MVNFIIETSIIDSKQLLSMTKNNFVVLDAKLSNVKFASQFLMQSNELKFVTPDGEIISKGSSLRISRYMRISNVIETIKGQLRFDVPERWYDPFERLFYCSPVTISNKTFYVVCLCFIYDINEGEESLWKTHGQIGSGKNAEGNYNEFIVRATFDVNALCKGLSKANPNTLFYLAPIDYSYSREEIIQRSNSRKNMQYSSIEDFINDMLVKRKAFSYEHEVRLFAVSENPFDIIDDYFCLMKLTMAKNVITNVMLPPLPIDRNEDKHQYHNRLEAQLLRLRHELRNEGFSRTIRQCRLYDIVK